MTLLGKIFIVVSISVLCFNFMDGLTFKTKVHYVSEENKNIQNNINVRFEFENKSSSEIKISSINPHCSCTAYEISSYHVKPNSKEFLLVTVPWSQLKNLGHVYVVLETDSKEKYIKVSIKVKD
ncbi:DUF1573 domain-containing protein [Belliella sp. R4-6]|uniref:DUF1573 domain-containing protein n=1 Tax=Belliella alkalica TaxID=1730871 RepID=A0ABS9V7K1_9BACT|nr:DUF1573 domain-containing protein [Belliella alkalica]MCH7412401.1 DUF1573 domain-containing protein [Belliella alkalica]